MFAKRLFNKVALHSQHSSLSSSDIDVKVVAHYGIPSTASILAFDPIQRLLAIGTLDGRIKVIGGDYIEGLLISSKQIPYKYLEFLHNQGFLVGVTNDNTIQVWDLKSRSITCSMQWESNITAFSVIEASHFMYAGDEYGLVSTIKFDAEVSELHQLPYRIPANVIYEKAEIPSHSHQPVIAVLPQPGTNRLLIAYEHGLIILWDISEGQVLVVRGIRNLHLKDGATGSRDEENNDDTNLDEKEIGTLCWASSDGSIIAVGYIDGDILLWNMSSTTPSKGSKGGMPNHNVIKLQLSSAEKRLPVITLHWSPISESSKGRDGFLFVYGGDEIGAEEVLTVMRLEWVSGNETLRCAVRLDLTLHGTFSDMILLGTNHAKDKNHKTHSYVLTNPGELHYYDDASLFCLINNQEKPSMTSIAHPSLIPTADPDITAARLSLVRGNSSKCLTELASAMKSGRQFAQTDSIKWPVTGGIPSQFSIGSSAIERAYIASYRDGSTRIYDATYSTLSLICVLEAEVPGIAVAGSNAPVTKVDICSQTLVMAVGNECGLVRIYDLSMRSEDSSFHMITESKNESHHFPNTRGHVGKAAICILNSAISALKFSNGATRLAIGYDCGRIAVVDTQLFSILFITDQGSCPVSSIIWNGFTQIITGVTTSSGSIASQDSLAELLFILTKDANIGIIDSQSGRVVKSQALHLKKALRAISMCLLEDIHSAPGTSSDKELDHSTKHLGPKSETLQHGESSEDHSPLPAESTISRKDFIYPMIVLCCEDSIHIYSVKSLIQGKAKPIHKVKLVHFCCWTAIFNENAERRGLLLLYETGLMEIRSFPNLEPVKELSLKSLLSWNFQPQMDKIISSSDGGEIAIVNRCEFALVSLLSGGNAFRIPESLPSLHDEVLAAASTVSTNHAAHQKKKQGTAPAVLGVFKGLKGGKSNHHGGTSLATAASFAHLEQIFSQPPFSDSLTVIDHQEAELDLDDIVIEEHISMPSTSTTSHEMKNHEKKKGKKSDRDKLLQGVTTETEPRVRTPEEILAAYRKTGDASSSAAHARSKLVERQAKLERISKGAEDLQNGAQNFSSLANELVKVMEERNNRKWWNV
ncbi:hypothetical protein QQ045_030677 [Rhodiola kirilowii]